MAGGSRDRASSRFPCRSSARRPEAEGWVSGARAPSWALPSLRMVTGRRGAFCPSRALQYSMPKMLLGDSSRAASSSGSRPVSARCRAAAKLTAPGSTSRSRSRKDGASSAAATRSRAETSPHSLPNSRCSTTPVAASAWTPPAANPSAEDTAQGRGSSSTRSAPLSTAALARACLRSRAKSPRCTKFPLITQTMAVSGPSAARPASRSRRCPLWSGLYSTIIPAAPMDFSPSK